jgi:CheY-like chemotaxis protein
MAKILLVEDDNNLREIYEARLQAEGYDIISARDGEEALVVAKSELPDLVISDVMMPKISGFEMLDILRNTEGLKDVRVIMLTALGQAEDQTRADSLGADRYLVKSQVTLEDIVNAAQQLLTGDQPSTPEATPAPEAPAVVAEPAPATEVTPVVPLAAAPPNDTAMPAEPQLPPTPAPTVPDVPDTSAVDITSSTDDQPTNAQESATVEQQIENFVDAQTGTPPPAVEPENAPPVTATPEEEQALNEAVTNLSGGEAPATTTAPETTPKAEDSETTTHKKIIVPISDDVAPGKKSLDELLAEESAKETTQLTSAPLAPDTAPAPALAPEPAPEAPADQPPAPAATPTPATQTPPEPQPSKGDFDPNSISL